MTIAIRYVPLLVYAAGFVTVPVVRAVRNRLVNRAISERNRNRAAWARALLGSGSDLPNMDKAPTTTDALPNVVTTAMTRAGMEAGEEADAAYSPEERRGLLAFLRRKVIIPDGP